MRQITMNISRSNNRSKSKFEARACACLQKIYPHAPVIHVSRQLINIVTLDVQKTIYAMVSIDPDSGIKQRLLAVENLGSLSEINLLPTICTEAFDRLDKGIGVEISNAINPTGHSVRSSEMLFSPKLFIYTNKKFCAVKSLIDVFTVNFLSIELKEEPFMFDSVFISYGGPDEGVASNINNFLVSNGLKTWFFPVNALPGQKLHRVMHDGVNKYDRVLLVCSKSSLVRPGVENELERVLEREAKEGGAEILIPVTLDDFVFSRWNPQRSDLASQVRSRVITKLPYTMTLTPDFISEADKLLAALKK